MIWSKQILKIFSESDNHDVDCNYHQYLEYCHPDDRTKLHDIHTQLKQGKTTSIDLEYRIVSKDSITKYVKEKCETRINSEGKFKYILGTLQDITERKAIERKLASKQKIMIHQSRLASMGEMIGNIAHQWRQPLNALSLSIQKLELLQQKNMLDADSLHQNVSKSMNLIREMSSTIDDFKSFFRPDKALERFSVKDSVMKALEIIAPSLEYHNIQTSVDVNPSLIINGYQNDFKQVILNLLSNAKDAVISNMVRMPLITVTTKDNQLIITDNGYGIDKSILPFIFDPYYTTKEEGKGTGIGLYMSKLIIEEHMQGKILVSNIDNGTMVVIEMGGH